MLYSILFIIAGLRVIFVKHIGVWGYRFDLANEGQYFIVGGFFIFLGIFILYSSFKKKSER
jgi:hypothetical protein